MANAATMLERAPVRALLVGYPGSGKTGALACLLNAGFKMRFLDFDGNLEPLLLHTDRAMLGNLDVLQFEDKYRMGQGFMEPIGIPTAFADAVKAMDEWKYTDESGTVVNLGKSADWGPDVIVVMDSLTKNGEAAHRRAMKLSNKTPLNSTDRVYGLAMGEQLQFVERLTSKSNKHHTIVISHLKMIAPKDHRHGDSELTKQLKDQVADLLPTRLYPSALGWQLPQQIGGEFPTLLEMVSSVKSGKVRRILRSVPRPELDLKLPTQKEFPDLDISDGMLQIFRALSPGSVALVEAQKAGAIQSASSVTQGGTL